MNLGMFDLAELVRPEEVTKVGPDSNFTHLRLAGPITSNESSNPRLAQHSSHCDGCRRLTRVDQAVFL